VRAEGVDSTNRRPIAYDPPVNVVITGGNRGLGAALARLLSLDGCEVIVGCRAPASAPPGTRALALDLASPASIARLVDALSGRPVDVLVNNAGAMFAALEKALKMDASLADEIRADEDFAPLRATAAFQKLVGRRRRAR
jgi:3-oxoacyl-[acyl-carrier protein] reductase